MLLSDLGAEVIRVERAQSVRGPAPETPHFDILLRGRRNIAIDLKNPAGVETLLKLLKGPMQLLKVFVQE
jgi:alpha-methylacyl-CoA racemase